MKFNNLKYLLFASLILLFYSCSTSHTVVSSVPGGGKDDNNNQFKALYYDAMKQAILGNNADALSSFKACLGIDAANPAANFQVADIMMTQKKPDSAVVYAARAVEYEPSNVWYEDLYARCLQKTGRFKEIPGVYKNVIKMHPENTDFYYKLAESQLALGQYKEALETYNELEKKLGVVDEDVSMSKLEIYEKTKDYKKAEEEIQKLINKNSGIPQYYDMLGNLYELEGKEDKALEQYLQTEQHYPEDPMVHLSLADYYGGKHEDAKAYGELKKAFEQSTLDVDTKIKVIIRLASFGNQDSGFAQALELAKIAAKANADEPRAHALYAKLLYENNNFTEARNQYRLAVGEDSSNFDLWGALLDLELQLNDYSGLADESKAATGLFPANPKMYLLNAIANDQQKNYLQAINSLKRGVGYIVNDSNLLEQFYSEMGDVNYYLKRYSASDSAYNIALKINPNDHLVLNNYAYYLSERDTNLALAEEMSKKANSLSPDNYTYEDTYSWIFFMEGKYQDAKVWEDKAMNRGGNNDATILEHYGDILFKLGDTDKAVEFWMKAKDKGNPSDLLLKKIQDKQWYGK